MQADPLAYQARGPRIPPRRTLRGRLRETWARARGRTPWALTRAALDACRRWAWSRDTMIIYRMDRRTQPLLPPVGVDYHVDRVEDFARYAGSIRHVSREAMMAAAERRRAAGEHCLTVVQDGVLVHYGWIQLDPGQVHLTEVDFTLPVPPKTAVIYDVWTEPAVRGRGWNRRSAPARIQLAFALGGEQVFTAVLENNVPSRRVVEGGGYRPVGRIVRTRWLGWSRSWLEAA